MVTFFLQQKLVHLVHRATYCIFKWYSLKGTPIRLSVSYFGWKILVALTEKSIIYVQLNHTTDVQECYCFFIWYFAITKEHNCITEMWSIKGRCTLQYWLILDKKCLTYFLNAYWYSYTNNSKHEIIYCLILCSSEKLRRVCHESPCDDSSINLGNDLDHSFTNTIQSYCWFADDSSSCSNID